MKMQNLLAATGLSLLGLGVTAAAVAATRAEIDQRVVTTLSEFHALSPANVGLETKAAGMLVFPRVTKGGVGVAGEYGQGVLQVKGKTVDYYSLGSASVGLTVGLAKHSEIIMFMTQESLDKFTATKGWSIGADAGITVVSKGTSDEIDSKTHDKPILAFAFSEKGLIGDLSLEGSKISRMER